MHVNDLVELSVKNLKGIKMITGFSKQNNTFFVLKYSANLF